MQYGLKCYSHWVSQACSLALWIHCIEMAYIHRKGDSTETTTWLLSLSTLHFLELGFLDIAKVFTDRCW